MASARKLPGSAYAGVNIGGGKIEIALLTVKKIRNYKLPKSKNLVAWFDEIASKESVKIIATALRGEGNLKKLGSDLWLRSDIVPLVVNNNLGKSTEDLARFAKDQFINDVAKIKLGPDNEASPCTEARGFLQTPEVKARLRREASIRRIASPAFGGTCASSPCTEARGIRLDAVVIKCKLLNWLLFLIIKKLLRGKILNFF